MLTPDDINRGVTRMSLAAYAGALMLIGGLWGLPRLLFTHGKPVGVIPMLASLGVLLAGFFGWLA